MTDTNIADTTETTPINTEIQTSLGVPNERHHISKSTLQVNIIYSWRQKRT